MERKKKRSWFDGMVTVSGWRGGSFCFILFLSVGSALAERLAEFRLECGCARVPVRVTRQCGAVETCAGMPPSPSPPPSPSLSLFLFLSVCVCVSFFLQQSRGRRTLVRLCHDGLTYRTPRLSFALTDRLRLRFPSHMVYPLRSSYNVCVQYSKKKNTPPLPALLPKTPLAATSFQTNTS